jgi:ferredoxin-NADP reductase/ferredoxin
MTTYYDGGSGTPTTEVPTASAWTAPATGTGADRLGFDRGAAGWEATTASAWGSSIALPRDEFTGDLVCTALTPVTHDVVDVTLRAADGGTLPYSPGQYFTFTFPGLGPGGEGLDRCYSVSSAAAVSGEGTEELTITVKRVPGGPVSAFVHERLRVGDTLRADGPYGVFGSDVRPGAGALYLSAGSGITPFLSMMRTRAALLENDERSLPLWSSVVHVHAAHSPADLVHRAEVMGLSDRHETTVIPVCSADSPAEAWAGVRGRLTSQKLAVLVPDLMEREVLVCGPTAFMEAVVAMVVDLGVPAERIHLESYVFGAKPRVPGVAQGVTGVAGASAVGLVGVPAGTGVESPAADAAVSGSAAGSAAVALPDPVMRQVPADGGDAAAGEADGGGEGASAGVFSIEFRGAGRTVSCPAGTTILAAAREAGIAHPSSCAEGVCGTCKATMVSGEVDMDHQGGIRPREVREGKILPCCSVPRTDVVLE